MSVFCLLWIPLFYFFRRSIVSRCNGGYVPALLLGCAIAAYQHFVGPLLPPGGFGFSRWINGFLDIISFPIILSFGACFLLSKFRLLPEHIDYANFSLVCLIPLSLYRAIVLISVRYPESLVAVTLLWTALCVGIPFLAGFAKHPRRSFAVFAVLGAFALPFVAATSWWAFFSQQTFLGFALFAVSLAPAVVSVVSDFCKK